MGQQGFGVFGEELAAVGGVEAFGEDYEVSAGVGGFEDAGAGAGEVGGFVDAWEGVRDSRTVWGRGGGPVASCTRASFRGFFNRDAMIHGS